MKNFSYYQGTDLPTAHAFYFNFIRKAVFVDIENVKEVVFSGLELQGLGKAFYVSDWDTVIVNSVENVLMPVPVYKVRRDGGVALEGQITKLADKYQTVNSEKIGALSFKSLDFDKDGFNEKAASLAKQLDDRMDEFRKDAEDYHCMNDFSDELKAGIHAAAYDEGHSSGLQEVFSCYDKFVDIADLALKK